MSVLQRGFLGSAAMAALIAMGPSAAFAFDEVNWKWDKTVTQTETINIFIDTDIDPTGLTEVEKLQIQIGDVNASSTVKNVNNVQPTDAGGTGTFSETFVFDTHTVEGGGTIDNIQPAGPISQNGINANFDGGTVDENTDPVLGDPTQLTFTVDGTVMVDPADSFDATTELPTVDSSATAVGNNQSINSEVATYLHDGQFLFDVGPGDPGNDDDFGGEDVVGAIGALVLGGQFGGNSHTALAVGASVLAITGTIDKAEVSASSEVWDIINARVDSSATAVGNNASVNVNEDGLPTDDSVLIADMTQFAAADIMATSNVGNVTVNNYNSLGLVDPLVASSATAVGNNVSINVGEIGE